METNERPMITLIVHCPNQPQNITSRPLGDVRPGRITLGRHASNDVNVDDITVSPRHGVIDLPPTGEAVYRDVGSVSGSRHNGTRVKEVALREGDVLHLGNAVVTITFDPSIACDGDATDPGDLGPTLLPPQDAPPIWTGSTPTLHAPESNATAGVAAATDTEIAPPESVIAAVGTERIVLDEAGAQNHDAPAPFVPPANPAPTANPQAPVAHVATSEAASGPMPHLSAAGQPTSPPMADHQPTSGAVAPGTSGPAGHLAPGMTQPNDPWYDSALSGGRPSPLGAQPGLAAMGDGASQPMVSSAAILGTMQPGTSMGTGAGMGAGMGTGMGAGTGTGMGQAQAHQLALQVQQQMGAPPTSPNTTGAAAPWPPAQSLAQHRADMPGTAAAPGERAFERYDTQHLVTQIRQQRRIERTVAGAALGLILLLAVVPIMLSVASRPGAESGTGGEDAASFVARMHDSASSEAALNAGGPQMTLYTVKNGDTLDAVAVSQLGDGTLSEEVFNANRDQLHTPLEPLQPGMVLRIPHKKE